MEKLHKIWDEVSEKYKCDKLETTCSRTMALEMMLTAYNLAINQVSGQSFYSHSQGKEIVAKDTVEYFRINLFNSDKI